MSILSIIVIATSLPQDADPLAAPQVLVMVLGVIVLGIVIMISIRAKIARRQADTPTPRERMAAIKKQALAREGGFAAEASMLDTAQRLAGQLNAKAERLDQLIADADARIATLRALESRIPSAREGAFDAEPGPAPAASARNAPDPLSEAVYRLADDGHGIVDIARELGEQTGKVELILALREG